jgi:phage-related protein (TIGR01555 family)
MKNIKSDGYTNLFGPDMTANHVSAGGFELSSNKGVENLYANNEIARRIVDVVPEEMVAPGFKINGIEDDSAFRSMWTGLKLDQSIVDLLCWSRLSGRSGMLLMINDGRSLTSPAVGGGKLEYVRIYEKAEFKVDSHETNQRNVRFGLPKFYRVTPHQGNEFKVHYTRFYVQEGRRLPNSLMTRDSGGASVLSSSLVHAILDYSECHRLATQVLKRKQQAVWKAKGLAALCDDTEGEYAARLRLAQVTDNAGIDKPIGIDADDEEYDILQGDVSGIPEFLSTKMDRIVELSGIHEIILKNKNTGGVSASQNTALQTFYKLIDRERKDNLHPILEFLIPFVIDEQEWDIEFEPLSIPSDTEKAAVLKSVAETLTQLIDNQTIDVEESRDTLDSMNLGVKLKKKPGPLPTREDVEAAKQQLNDSQKNQNPTGEGEGNENQGND